MGKIFRWTLLFVVLVIFASGAVAVYTVFFSTANDVMMPSLREISVIDAMAEAKRLGFTVKVEEVVSSLPPGRVLAQSPEAGIRVRKDKTVLLQVSKGAARRAVPDVRGLIVAQAQNVIQEQGFEVGDVLYIQEDSRPLGFVIAQSPAAPANVPGDKKIDLLVNQTKAGADGKILIPDVAQMLERQARELLTASGLRVATVDPIYSPNATEGHVIGTRPAAGTAARVGDGVRLRVATTRRPAGVPEPPPPAERNPSPPERSSSQVVVMVPGHGEIVVGGNETNTQRPSAVGSGSNRATGPQIIPNPALSPVASAPTDTQPVTPPGANVQTQQKTPQAPNLPAGVGKIARIRHSVPPLAQPLTLKIELIDPSGTKVLVDRDVKGGERISLDEPYSKECAVTIYLGGKVVWQDRYM